MLLPILYHLTVREARVEATDSLARRVECDQCGVAYWYLVRKAATGIGNGLVRIGEARAVRKAGQDAEQRVKQKLATETDPVPCPACGRYSDRMIPADRRFRYRRGRWVPRALIAAAPFLFFPIIALALTGAVEAAGAGPDEPVNLAAVLAASAVLAATPGLAVWAWRAVRASRFDPNRDLTEEERFYLAGQRAKVAGLDGMPP